MDVSTADLVSELKGLRKGRGLFAVQLEKNVGPALRAAFGISGESGAAELRRTLSERLLPLIDSLPGDLRISLLAAFGLTEQARHPFYIDRVKWAASTLKRDARTVRRRIDDGIARLAELAVDGTAPDRPASHPSPHWHTEVLRVALTLEQPVPEVFEFRRVVADADDLTELDLALTLTAAGAPGRPMPDSDLQVDVFYGGSLVSRQMQSSDRVGLSLRLPSPLRKGERHDIALRFRARFHHPHYVCVPRHPCDLFDLHVRFPQPPPAWVGRLERVFQDDVRDASARGTPIEADGVGEIHEQFRHLTPGFAYGVRWQESVADATDT
ncbi:hypothetical protein JHE00_14335 [Prauserella sp. ASG 168]|uniref:Uncharacterized protein n=1 Tax=Prauserella cavernicola TaxID=2800127 RepID=A0A934QSN6_9PSEU|nr:hypothetical protein [Prauserella cavernicola]